MRGGDFMGGEGESKAFSAAVLAAEEAREGRQEGYNRGNERISVGASSRARRRMRVRCIQKRRIHQSCGDHLVQLLYISALSPVGKETGRAVIRPKALRRTPLSRPRGTSARFEAFFQQKLPSPSPPPQPPPSAIHPFSPSVSFLKLSLPLAFWTRSLACLSPS